MPHKFEKLADKLYRKYEHIEPGTGPRYLELDPGRRKDRKLVEQFLAENYGTEVPARTSAAMLTVDINNSTIDQRVDVVMVWGEHQEHMMYLGHLTPENDAIAKRILTEKCGTDAHATLYFPGNTPREVIDAFVAKFGLAEGRGYGSTAAVTGAGDSQYTCAATNQYGIHARPAAIITKEAKKYDAEVTVENPSGHKVSAKSIMGLMTLEASRGVKLKVHATGPEAEKAREAVIRLINSGFGES